MFAFGACVSSLNFRFIIRGEKFISTFSFYSHALYNPINPGILFSTIYSKIFGTLLFRYTFVAYAAKLKACLTPVEKLRQTYLSKMHAHVVISIRFKKKSVLTSQMCFSIGCFFISYGILGFVATLCKANATS